MYRVQFDKVGKASEQVYLKRVDNINTCLLYTSDAADEE